MLDASSHFFSPAVVADLAGRRSPEFALALIDAFLRDAPFRDLSIVKAFNEGRHRDAALELHLLGTMARNLGAFGLAKESEMAAHGLTHADGLGWRNLHAVEMALFEAQAILSGLRESLLIKSSEAKDPGLDF